MPLTILMYGDRTSYNGQIRENVGLKRCRIREVSLYICTYIVMQHNYNYIEILS